jgi:arginine N-succinyltransferase
MITPKQSALRRVRLARLDDLDQLVALATRGESGMTTMPRDREHMAARIAEATASVEPTRKVDGREVYMFVLDEGDDAAAAIAGTSAIYAAVGLDRPFYSYKITKISKYSPDIDRRFDYTILQTSNDFSGCTEVGTLYLPPENRGGGRGLLLSLARFMFLAAHRERFGEVVMAEMRGWVDADGRSPFWDAVGHRFFGLEFEHADRLSGKEFRFMQDMLPGTPIHVDLLPQAAIDVIGRPHSGSEPAAKMLRRLGLRNHGYIDIFDAGLCLDAFIDDTDVVRRARRRTAHIVEEPPDAESDARSGLITNTRLAEFAMIEATITDEQAQPLSREQARALRVVEGDPIVTYILDVRQQSA